MSQMIYNDGSDIEVVVSPTDASGAPTGWAEIIIVLDANSAKMFKGPPERDGLSLFLSPLPGQYGPVAGKLVFTDGGKPFLEEFFAFSLVIDPKKVRPTSARATVRPVPPTDNALSK